MPSAVARVVLVVGFVSSLLLVSASTASAAPPAGGTHVSICTADWLCGKPGGGGGP